MAKKSPKGSWIVNVTCTVKKEVICMDCTKEQAEEDPFRGGGGGSPGAAHGPATGISGKDRNNDIG